MAISKKYKDKLNDLIKESSVISKQTEIFHIQYQNIDNDLNKLSKQIPNETVMQIREITGLKSEYLSKLTRYEF